MKQIIIISAKSSAEETAPIPNDAKSSQIPNN